MSKKKNKRIRGIIERLPPIPLPKRTKTRREQIDSTENKHKGREWDT